MTRLWSTLLYGAGSLLDLLAMSHRRRPRSVGRMPSAREAGLADGWSRDAAALRGDWERIGRDFWRAVEAIDATLSPDERQRLGSFRRFGDTDGESVSNDLAGQLHLFDRENGHRAEI